MYFIKIYSNYNYTYFSMALQNVSGSREEIFSNDSHNYGRFVADDFTDKNENSDRAGRRKRLSRMQQQTLVEMWVFDSTAFSDPREFFPVWLIFFYTGTARFTSNKGNLWTKMCIDDYELLRVHWLACIRNPST